jgi:uncharacterized damage-inducible protein DinB
MEGAIVSPNESEIAAKFYIADLENEVQTTIRIFQAMPNENLDYRPDEKSRTALELARHIALDDPWMLDAVTKGEFAPIPDQTNACGLMTPADCAKSYKEAMPVAIERVKSVSADALVKEIDLMGLFKMPGIGFLSLAVRHSVHHRGQLATYLRAMGGQVPQIYGPSADETMEAAAS